VVRSSLPSAALAACVVLAAGCVFDRTGVEPFDAGAGPDSSVDQRDDSTQEEDIEPDQSNCPAECDSCEDGSCRILGDKGCKNGCTCPAGMDCEVVCGYPSHCLGAIDCSQATSCDIQCNPAGGIACKGNITCGSGDCTVACGYDACEGEIDCSQASSCDITCDGSGGANACQKKVTCGTGFCDVTCNSGSCHGDIDCSSSCGCSVNCQDQSSCWGAITCPSQCSGSCAPEDGCDSC
jgi:hypothetical protein